MPGMNGLEAARRIRRMSPLSKIVFLSQHDTIETIREAFRAGGYGYVAKSDAAHDLISAVRSVSQKKCYVNARFADRLCKGLKGSISYLVILIFLYQVAGQQPAPGGRTRYGSCPAI